MNWTLDQLIAKAKREGVTLSELGRRGGQTAARLRKLKAKKHQSYFVFDTETDKKGTSPNMIRMTTAQIAKVLAARAAGAPIYTKYETFTTNQDEGSSTIKLLERILAGDEFVTELPKPTPVIVEIPIQASANGKWYEFVSPHPCGSVHTLGFATSMRGFKHFKFAKGEVSVSPVKSALVSALGKTEVATHVVFELES